MSKTMLGHCLRMAPHLVLAAALSAVMPPAAAGFDAAVPDPLGAWSVRGGGAPPARYTVGTGKACEKDAGEGTLVCNCDPPGAQVYLDGKLIGEAPVRKECLPAGEYTLRLVKPGFETSESRVTVKKDVTLTVEDKMSEARGEVVVTSDPPGVTVIFDGRRQGVTPLTMDRVTEGVHEIRLTREYFEDAVATVALGRADRKEVDLTLRRRVLLVELAGRNGDGERARLEAEVAGALSGFDAVHVIKKDIGALEEGLVERGLEASSLGFLGAGKTRLDIEDSAVLSGIMEQAGVELALVALPAGDGGNAASLTLYSTASDFGDRAAVRADEGLPADMEAFLDGWKGQQERTRPAVGARLARRPEGAEVERVLPGYPADKAGLLPGDVVVSVDGRDVPGAGLTSLLRAGAEQEFTVLRGGDLRKMYMTPVESPVEPCAGAGGCLVNLALVDSLAILDETAGQAAPEELRGQAALNLGYAYSLAGEPEKAAEAFMEAETEAREGVCAGTALYRLGVELEKLGRYEEAAAAYEKVVSDYPEATLESADGPWAATLAAGRLEEMKKRHPSPNPGPPPCPAQ